MDSAANTSPNNPASTPLREAIAQRARELWQKNGQPSGRDVEFWLAAERQVLGADPAVKTMEGVSVSAPEYAEATDANHAKEQR